MVELYGSCFWVKKLGYYFAWTLNCRKPFSSSAFPAIRILFVYESFSNLGINYSYCVYAPFAVDQHFSWHTERETERETKGKSLFDRTKLHASDDDNDNCEIIKQAKSH